MMPQARPQEQSPEQAQVQQVELLKKQIAQQMEQIAQQIQQLSLALSQSHGRDLNLKIQKAQQWSEELQMRHQKRKMGSRI
ncbi:MAG: hypothetical protein JRE40_03005 [Deltaproteobacteria bacterium]|nr:hypothetical protein [Deltaproteobacteria bacterium]